jgi:CRP/FNR family transcriptional regulator, cyclic AMP receptor protein
MNINGPLFPLLRENKLFAGMSDTTVADCARQFTIIHSRRRQHLYRQGDPCGQVYCMLRGSIRVARIAEDGSEFTTRIVGRSDLFGEEALFDDVPYSATATPVCDGIVAVCTATTMRSLIARYPTLSINIAHCLREDQNRTLNRLEQVSYKSVRDRLLSLLHELATQCDAGDVRGGKYEIKLTHVEIASLIGSTRETVSLEVNKLVRAGLVAKRGRKILIDLAANVSAA